MGGWVKQLVNAKALCSYHLDQGCVELDMDPTILKVSIYSISRGLHQSLLPDLSQLTLLRAFLGHGLLQQREHTEVFRSKLRLVSV